MFFFLETISKSGKKWQVCSRMSIKVVEDKQDTTLPPGCFPPSIYVEDAF